MLINMAEKMNSSVVMKYRTRRNELLVRPVLHAGCIALVCVLVSLSVPCGFMNVVDNREIESKTTLPVVPNKSDIIRARVPVTYIVIASHRL